MLKKRVGEISLMNLDRVPHDQGRLRLHGPPAHRQRRHYRLPARHARRGRRREGDDLHLVADRPRHPEPEEGYEIKATTPNGADEFEPIKLITIHDAAAGRMSEEAHYIVDRTLGPHWFCAAPVSTARTTPEC